MLLNRDLGGYFSAIAAPFSHVSAENRKTQSKFECVECGYAENADLNAAINILRAGHARLACQVNGAVMPSATGTHRSYLPHSGGEAVGIPCLKAGEDVNAGYVG
jgi:hypothetical protein